MIDLSTKHLDIVRRILAEHVPASEVRAFGSRVSGDAKKHSDLDLAVVGRERMPLRKLGELRAAFEESTLPIRVDVLDWRGISPEFQKVVERKYEVLQEGVGVLEERLYDLIVEAATSIPEDVETALSAALEREKAAGNALAVSQLELMLDNVRLAREKRRPLCQDTGTPNFFVKLPAGLGRSKFIAAAESAVVRATGDGILRPNSVCPLTGENTGNNLGPGNPAFHWEESPDGLLNVELLLKGGGSENVGAQYALPNPALSAERGLDGVEKCVIDAVERAGGKGCPPSIVSVCVGGDRAGGYAAAKRNFLRRIGERSDIPALAELETKLLEKINATGIGPMGLGGAATALDVFATALNRLPATYYVTVSIMCWSFRRAETRFQPDEK